MPENNQLKSMNRIPSLYQRGVLPAAIALALSAPFIFTQLFAADGVPESATPKVIVNTDKEPVAMGKFNPTWESLSQYKAPEWFRNAKFGIWAHWGPQCQPEAGDWYARNMYIEGSGDYKDHLARYGHPSLAGFKDIIHEWKAENWDPEKLVALYKRVGAQYFFALADHHDNFDLWDSTYQPWNSVAIGPQKNIIAGWAKAAHDQHLPFGVSVHAAHAWSWYEVTQGADKTGPKAGVPYDGKLTKADGKGLWWDGLDPQDLYAQNHKPGQLVWNWGPGASQPDQAYCDKFYNRVVDLINKYHPDLIYFDDTSLPLWPVSDAGLKIAAHFYNTNMQLHGGQLQAVMFGKILDKDELKTETWDIERGVPNSTLPDPWQTDTCLGNWHYNRALYKGGGYKSAETVVRMLADIVSKNGNLLLNVPVRGDGTIDEKEQKILENIATWMDVNKECIFDTRPWITFGEGPANQGAAIAAQGFNEGRGKPFTAQDIRFTTKGNVLYAILLGVPAGPTDIKSLGIKANLLSHSIVSVEQLGAGPVRWTQNDNALHIEPAAAKPVSDAAVVYKIVVR